MYINYYSRIRNGLGIDMERELSYQRGRIVTKVVEQSNITTQQLHRLTTKADALEQDVNTFIAHAKANNHTIGHYYYRFRIPKHSGGERIITAPKDELKILQLKVLRFLSGECKLLPHNAAHSFIKDRNCKTAMTAHQAKGARWFLKLDIENFFPSCVQSIMLDMLMKIHPIGLLPKRQVNNIIKVCFLNGGLPQGAPSSPLLSNLYLMDFDYNLTNKLKEQGFTYTRYADDILISKPSSFQFSPIKHIVEVELPFGVSLKRSKTRYGSCNGSNWNLGLMYNQQKNITVGYRQKHKLKNAVHNLFTKDINTLPTTEFNDKKYSLLGLLGYYRFIEPEYFDNLIAKWRGLGYDI